jgi:hypothetical protein
MTEIASSRRIGIGLRRLGFKCGCVSSTEVIAKALKNPPSRTCSSFNVHGIAMNVSVISWHLFLRALDKQDSAGLDKWLARWVFADDGVRLSMRPTTQDGLAVERDKAA